LTNGSADILSDDAHRARRNDFSLVAPIYDGLATLVFGGAIRRAQIELLPALRETQRALIIGGGTGWFLLELLDRTDVEHVLYVEKSEIMLDKSRELLAARAPQWANRVEFRLGTDESVTAQDGVFDLLVTNFFLDLFNDTNCSHMIEKLAANLGPTGRWLFVDFHTPEAGWRRTASDALFKVMYGFFTLTSHIESRRPPEYQATFDRLGIVTELEEQFYATMIRAKLLRKVAG
jgi:ubiquinone/menaquinone biosynthesis C-methylase UbiE